MSTIVRWWTHHGDPASRRAIGAVLLVVVLAASGVAALTPTSPGHARAAWVTGPSPPTAEPSPPRTAPEPKGAIPAPSPPPAWLVEPAGDFTGWAVVDLVGGAGMTVTASQNAAELSTTASMIKAWIAADYLRRVTETGGEPSPGRLLELTAVIRDSDNTYADVIFRELGAHDSIERLIDICGLPYARAVPQQWSGTLLSPVDTALMGVCIADGRAAGPGWTDWLLEEMRLVRGLGDFGIRDALPAEQRSSVAIKNGWIARKGEQAWHVSCLAIGETWTMGVMTRYPEDLGFEHGVEICRSLAAEHLPAPADDPGPNQPDSGPQLS